MIVGGFGHVGLPLGVSLASEGRRVCALDVNTETGAQIALGRVPFKEDGCEPALQAALRNGTFEISYDPAVVADAETVTVVIGTPVDRHMNPEFDHISALIASLAPFLTSGQLLVLRSTVYPGTSERIRGMLLAMGSNAEVAYCPERIAEGKAMEELRTLPQIISAFTSEGYRRCRELFEALTPDIVELSPLEAELAKLFTNSWRYTLFATANQFFMLANDHGADFYRIHHAVTHNYPRASAMPRPGFAAGPCLFKDTLQLAAFNNHNFSLGHAAMSINEGLPNYLVHRAKAHRDLSNCTVGILGMAFKAESDDKRDSLSYKLRKILGFESKAVLCSDVYIDDPDFVSAGELIERSDVIFVGTPHREYRALSIPQDTFVVDIWDVWGKGCTV